VVIKCKYLFPVLGHYIFDTVRFRNASLITLELEYISILHLLLPPEIVMHDPFNVIL